MKNKDIEIFEMPANPNKSIPGHSGRGKKFSLRKQGRHSSENERLSNSLTIILSSTSYVDRTKPTIILDPKDELFSEVE